MSYQLIDKVMKVKIGDTVKVVAQGQVEVQGFVLPVASGSAERGRRVTVRGFHKHGLVVDD